jgi:transcriptional regulator with XRE-family HTH domain
VPSKVNAFGVWLKQARVERGKSLRVIAADIGISAPTIFRLESGKYSPTCDMVESIVNALVSEDYNTANTIRLLNAGLRAAGFATEDDNDDNLDF